MNRQTWKFSFARPNDITVVSEYNVAESRHELYIEYETSTNVWDVPACLYYGANGSVSLAEMISELHWEVLKALTTPHDLRTDGYEQYSDEELYAFLCALRQLDSKPNEIVCRGKRADQIIIDDNI